MILKRTTRYYFMRKKINQTPAAERPTYAMWGLHSHRRPVTPLPFWADPDSPATKLITEPWPHKAITQPNL